MTFLNPILVGAGLACVIAPILIHILMRRRRRPVAWGAMMFLMQAYRQQRRRLRMEQLLLLGSRCLIVVLVALALGKPVWDQAHAREAQRPRDWYVVLDNSLASQLTDGQSDRTALDAHKARALAWMDASVDSARGDRVGLMLASRRAEGVVLPPSADLADVRRRIERTRPTDAPADWQGALEAIASAHAQRSAQGTDARPMIVLISQWLQGSADLARPLASVPGLEGARLLATPATNASDAGNVGIVRVRGLRPVLLDEGDAGPAGGASAPIEVTLARSGTMPAGFSTIEVELRSNPAVAGTIASRRVAWSSGQTGATITLSVDAPPQSGDAELVALARVASGDVPNGIAGDDAGAAALARRAVLDVALVSDGTGGPSTMGAGTGLESLPASAWLALALRPGEGGDLASTGPRARAGVRVRSVASRELTPPTTGAEPAATRDAGALLITEPQALDASAWQAARRLLERGGLVMVMPGALEQTHLWPDAMERAFGLGAALSREARVLEADASAPGRAVVAPPSASAAPGASSTSPTPDEGDDALALIRGELPELLRGVSVRRLLSVDRLPPGSRTLLALEDGSPVLVQLRAQRGSLVLWLAPPHLAWTDLPARPLMVPLVQELVRQGAPRSAGAVTIEAGATLPALPTGTTELAPGTLWRSGAEGLTALPFSGAVATGEQPAAPRSQAIALRDAGVWLPRDASGRRVGTLVVEASSAGGAVRAQASDAVARWLTGSGATVEELSDTPTNAVSSGAASASMGDEDRGAALALWLLVAAALVALVEVVLARRFSHAYAPAGAATPAGGAP